MKSISKVLVLTLSGSLFQCGSTPLACVCQVFRVVSNDNGSPIVGATLRVITPEAPPQYSWQAGAPGEYGAAHFFCHPRPMEFEVSHPRYRTRRISHTPPFEVLGASSALCSTPRPPVINITLESL
jgi:hypothetical protein